MANNPTKMSEDPASIEELTAKLSLLQQDVAQIREHVGLEAFDLASIPKEETMCKDGVPPQHCPSAATEVLELRSALGTKVSWSAFKIAMDKIDEMRVFLETAAEKVFLGHKQFVLEELDKKADIEAVNWSLRSKGCDNEVKALRARVEHLERVNCHFNTTLANLKNELNSMYEFVAPSVLRNTSVCKILWDLMGLSDPSARSILASLEEPLTTCSAIVEQTAGVIHNETESLMQSSTGTHTDKVAARVVGNNICQPSYARKERDSGNTQATHDPFQTWQDREAERGEAGARLQENEAFYGLKGSLGATREFHYVTSQPSQDHFRSGIVTHPLDLLSGIEPVGKCHLEVTSQGYESSGGCQQSVALARPLPSDLKNCEASDGDGTGNRRRPTEGILQRMSMLKTHEKVRYCVKVCAVPLNNDYFSAKTPEIKPLSVCERCQLPRGLPVCGDSAIFGHPVVPWACTSHAHWYGRNGHMAPQLAPQKAASSTSPPFGSTGKIDQQTYSFCCYPGYIEYSLRLVEEKLHEVQEKHSIMTDLANSLAEKKRSEEEIRATHIDWMVKEVAKRLASMELVPLSPKVYQIEQGVIQRDLDGKMLQGVQNIPPVGSRNEPGLSESDEKFLSCRGTSSPCSPRRPLSASENEKKSMQPQSPRRSMKNIFASIPSVTVSNTNEYAPVFGRRNKNEEADCLSLAQVIADDLEQSLRKKIHPAPEKSHFWKRHTRK